MLGVILAADRAVESYVAVDDDLFGLTRPARQAQPLGHGSRVDLAASCQRWVLAMLHETSSGGLHGAEHHGQKLCVGDAVAVVGEGNGPGPGH